MFCAEKIAIHWLFLRQCVKLNYAAYQFLMRKPGEIFCISSVVFPHDNISIVLASDLVDNSPEYAAVPEMFSFKEEFCS